MDIKSRKEIHSPLRYPGGKSKFLQHIIPNIYPDYIEFREPFVGGGSVYLAAMQRINQKALYRINDLNFDLYCFWKEIKENGKKLIDCIQELWQQTKNGKELFKTLMDETIKKRTDFERATRFFILNRITFSGTADSGGFSEEAFHKRFTASSIERLRPLPNLLKNVVVEFGDYEKLLFEKGKDVMIFLDPPYLTATKSKLYGKKGDLHQAFDHERFAINMKKCPHKWLITYDDCEEIQKLFSFSNTYFYYWSAKYGMTNAEGNKKVRKGNELIIANYPLPPKIQANTTQLKL
jgi:DNA adenine methylase